MNIIIGIGISLLPRIYVAMGGYSGINDPPQFGDFEAQRHWMELAVNSPPTEWYQPSGFNNPLWWPLDYPPLSGYYAWFWGQIAYIYDRSIVAPVLSRGLESDQVKLLMRLSAIISELVFLYPPLIYMFIKYFKNQSTISLLLILCNPLLILIDHGHFQYNCILLGLSLTSMLLLLKGRLYLGSIAFVLALNFKIMGLYYSIPIFIYILSQCWNNSKSIFQFITSVIKVGIVVMLTTLVIWLPWLSDINLTKQVLHSIFPVHRGLYQLQVATFWCFSNIFIKWHQIMEHTQLFKLASLLTLLGCAREIVQLFKNPARLRISMFVMSQAFFLLSFHVHEKTILLPLIFLMASAEQLGYIYIEYTIAAMMTLHPLMIEDRLFTEYCILFIIFTIIGVIYEQKPQYSNILISWYSKLRYIPLFIYAVVFGLQCLIQPPLRFPYLYELIIQMLGFGVYVLVYIIAQIAIPEKQHIQ